MFHVLANRVHLSTTGAIILSISHGYTINPHAEDSLVKQADAALDIFSRTLVPGASVTDIFPICECQFHSFLEAGGKTDERTFRIPIVARLPKWVMGQAFHDRVEEYSTVVNTFLEKPYTFVRHQMVGYTFLPD